MLQQILIVLLLVHILHAQNSCYTPENVIGNCRSIYDCQSVLIQLKGQLSRHTANYLRSLQCVNGIGVYPHVCCIPYNNHQPQETNAQSMWLSNLNRELSKDKRNGNIVPGACGLTALSHRIYGGNGTQLDDYPWMALLEYQKRNRRERKLSCGGSLINTRYVLTAAHCLFGEIERRVGELVGVRLGEYDITKDVDCLGNTCADPILVFGIQKKIPHDGYNERNKNRANDIGLIRLDSEVTFTDYVSPVCLPSSVNSPRTSANEKLVSAGWGRSITMRQSAIKQHVELPLVNHLECVTKYSDLGITLSNNQICAGGVYGYDTCDGDSGNPLMKIATNTWVVEGIVSFGLGCGLEGFPAVYTKVSNYEDWILKNIRA